MNANTPRRFVQQQLLNVGGTARSRQAEVESGHMKHMITIKTGYIKNYEMFHHAAS